jgi:hypothetical protein
MRRMPQKMGAEPVPATNAVSPDGEWLLMRRPMPTTQAVRGGPKIRICDFCDVDWGLRDKFFYVRLRDVGEMGGGKVCAIALPGKPLPALPLDMTGISILTPGPNPSTHAYVRLTVQRNLLRIPLN